MMGSGGGAGDAASAAATQVPAAQTLDREIDFATAVAASNVSQDPSNPVADLTNLFFSRTELRNETLSHPAFGIAADRIVLLM